MLPFNTVFHLQMIFWRSSQIQIAFNMLMICFAWERVRNKNENQSWSEKSWINYVKWMAGKMGRLTKTWHLPRPQSNGIDLKGEPKIYIFLGKFYLITFYAWLPWNTTPENLSEPKFENQHISFDFKPPLPPLIKVWSAVRGWGAIIRLNLTPQMAPIAMITTVKTDLKRPVRLQCQFGRNLIFETIWMKLGEKEARCQEQLFRQIALSATNQPWTMKSGPYAELCQKQISSL